MPGMHSTLQNQIRREEENSYLSLEVVPKGNGMYWV